MHINQAKALAKGLSRERDCCYHVMRAPDRDDYVIASTIETQSVYLDRCYYITHIYCFGLPMVFDEERGWHFE